jgi:hypothetical protein
MFENLREIARTIIPVKSLSVNPPRIHPFMKPFYRGSKFNCNLCNKTMRSFLKIDNNHVCPYCGSLAQERRLYYLLSPKLCGKNIRILDLSPSRSFSQMLSKISSLQYDALHLTSKYTADHKENATSGSGLYDLILCSDPFRLLEENLGAADQLYQMLEHGGNMLLQVPMKKTEESDLVHQLKNTFQNRGFSVIVNEYVEKPGNRLGLFGREMIINCFK